MMTETEMDEKLIKRWLWISLPIVVLFWCSLFWMCFADTPPQVINKQCSTNQFFSQIQPGPNNINCTQPSYSGLSNLPAFIDSLNYVAGNVSLVNDVASPSASEYYGTNGSGTRGWFALPSVTAGNLTDTGTDGITVTGGTGAVLGSGTSLSQHVAGASNNGYLASGDWSTFNSKQSALTFSDSLNNSSGTITLKNDSATPGNSKYYGTNSSGTLGFNAVPAPAGTAGGEYNSVQFNSGGSFGGNANFNWDSTYNILNVPTVNVNNVNGSPSGSYNITDGAGNGDAVLYMDSNSLLYLSNPTDAGGIWIGSNKDNGVYATFDASGNMYMNGNPQGSGNLTAGAFWLTPTNLGNNDFRDGSTHPAASGTWRSGNAVNMCWRNAANSADICFDVDSSNFFDFGAHEVLANSVALGSAAGAVTSASAMTMGTTAAQTLSLETNSIARIAVSSAGLIGLGGTTTNASAGVYVQGVGLTGTTQQGINIVTQTTSAATTEFDGLAIGTSTASGSYTTPLASAINVSQITKGSGNTITRAIGYKSSQQVNGTNNAQFADNQSFTGSYFLNSTDTNPSLFSGSISSPSHILNGSSSGAITIQPQASAGTYNFNMPITAGSAGQMLTSQGGSTSAMTWTTPVTNNYWSGSTSSGTSWTTTSSTYGNGTNTGGNTLTTKFSNGITVSAAATGIAGITFTPASSTAVYQITANFMQWNSGANNNSFRLYDGTNVVSTAAGFGTGIVPTSITGIYAPNTASAVTVEIQLATSGGTLHMDSEGVSALSTPAIEWTLTEIK